MGSHERPPIQHLMAFSERLMGSTHHLKGSALIVTRVSPLWVILVPFLVSLTGRSCLITSSIKPRVTLRTEQLVPPCLTILQIPRTGTPVDPYPLQYFCSSASYHKVTSAGHGPCVQVPRPCLVQRVHCWYQPMTWERSAHGTTRSAERFRLWWTNCWLDELKRARLL